MSVPSMKRIWFAAAAAMITLVLAVVAIGVWAVPARRGDLWFELAKAGIQLVVVIGLGGVVSSVLRTADVARERRKILDEHRFAIFQQLVTAYHQLKFVRRNLRMVGLRDGPDALRSEQVEALRAGMTTVVDVDLTLEQVYRELDARSVFDRSQEIHGYLGQLLTYISKLVEEWETHGASFWPDRQTGRVRDLVVLQAFLGSAEDDFRPNAARPMGRVEAIVREELLGSDETRDGDSARQTN